MVAAYLPRLVATWPSGSSRLGRPPREPGIGRDQVLRAVLELAMEAFHRLERVDLGRALVGPNAHDPRKAKREAGLMTRGTLDHVEGHFDHDCRLDLPKTAETAQRMGLEPRGHFGNLGVRQARVGLPDRDQPFGGLVVDRERVVG